MKSFDEWLTEFAPVPVSAIGPWRYWQELQTSKDMHRIKLDLAGLQDYLQARMRNADEEIKERIRQFNTGFVREFYRGMPVERWKAWENNLKYIVQHLEK